MADSERCVEHAERISKIEGGLSVILTEVGETKAAAIRTEATVNDFMQKQAYKSGVKAGRKPWIEGLLTICKFIIIPLIAGVTGGSILK